ncbi:MAG: ATPase, T2SS/T4P/T4SS family [Candidatus Eremiobacteraeota bacterium]|nr:ATPase, T2SS/T4P/T4SS family [Candidatus Eremiobacteraeota bacterium]
MKKEIGALLVEHSLVTEQQFQEASDLAAKVNEPVRKILVSMGFVTENDITEVIGKHMGVHFVDLDNFELDSAISRSIPEHLAHRYKVIPIAQKNNRLTLAMADPLNVKAVDDIGLITGFDIEPVIAAEEAIEKAIHRQFGVTDISAMDFSPAEVEDAAEEEIALDKLKELMDEAPIVRVVNLIISQAINDKTTDIHIEPEQKRVRVMYRVDGVLHDVIEPPKHIQIPMVARIKIIADMDIAERRVPQDGLIHLRHDSKEFYLHISTVPCVHGEKVLMRIIDETSVMRALDKGSQVRFSRQGERRRPEKVMYKTFHPDQALKNLLQIYETGWSGDNSPIEFVESGSGPLIWAGFKVNPELDHIAFACLYLVTRYWSILSEQQACSALRRAWKSADQAEKAYNALQQDLPLRYQGSFRAFPLLACLEILQGREELDATEKVPYDMLGHSRSDVRLYAYKSLWLYRSHCDVERALPILFKNIDHTLGYVEEAIGLARSLLDSDAEFFRRAAEIEPGMSSQFSRRIEETRRRGFLPQCVSFFVDFDRMIQKVAEEVPQG